MRSTYKQLYYINRGKVKADGTTSIMCRITIDGKAAALSTGLYCRPEEWNSKKGEVKNNRLNGMLCEYKKRVDKTYAELLKVNGVISAELLKIAMTGTADIPKYILQAGEVERENLKIRSIQIDSTSSYRQSKCIITILANTSVLWVRRTCFYRYNRRVWHQLYFISENKLPS